MAYHHYIFSVLLLLLFQLRQVNSCSIKDFQSLLAFKHDVTDPLDRLSSWKGKNCCLWEGVTCNNKTGRVIRLDLHNPASDDDHWSLGGGISQSLIGLDFLTYLDLSFNEFEDISIPKFFGSFQSLRYLNRSAAGFEGYVPPHLGNLSALRQLDLSHNTFLTIHDSRWVTKLNSLEYLDLSVLIFTEKSGMLLGSLNTLHSLTELYLSQCVFQDETIPVSLPYTNFSSLSKLDLSYNYFGSALPLWIFNITTLKTLNLGGNSFRIVVPESIDNLKLLTDIDFSFNQFVEGGGFPQKLQRLCRLRSLYFSRMNITGDLATFERVLNGCSKMNIQNIDLGGNLLKGTLPEWLGELKNLKSLQLYENAFSGSIPASLGSLHSLECLYIAGTNLNGTIPNSLGSLSNLAYIDLSHNYLQGTISEFHFENLTRLKHLDISFNNLSLKIRHDWLPPFKLNTILLGSCNVGPRFPLWLKNQFNYSLLDMSHCEINDHMPNWFWNLSSIFERLDLSHNKISGEVPTQLRVNPSDQTIDLSSNLFEGPVPLFPLCEGYIDLSNNLFSDVIPSIIGDVMPKLQFLSLSNNIINGNIPSSICKMDILIALDLSRNRLLGKMLNCWKPNSKLKILDLSNNDLIGNIPSKISSLSSLISLHLSNNNLYGGLPLSLKNCSDLITVDLGNNKLTGRVPTWLGECLSNLRILSLQRNIFTENIPNQLSKLSSLQILDLSHNNLSGAIPQSLGNLTTMTATPKGELFFYPIQSYKEHMILSIKNRKDPYTNLLPLVTTLDLSENVGQIPNELTSLYGLLNLNLSGNQLDGSITNKFGQLQQLESLDLSRNHLNGPIPTSLANLTFLNHLNLSHNNLSGKIPMGNQLSTFTDPSTYIGNQYLCGFPLPNDCETNQKPVPTEKGEGHKESNEKEMLWTYFSLGAGFIFTFWGTWCVLLFKKSWREGYFRAADKAYDKLYVMVAIKLRILKEKLRERGKHFLKYWRAYGVVYLCVFKIHLLMCCFVVFGPCYRF